MNEDQGTYYKYELTCLLHTLLSIGSTDLALGSKIKINFAFQLDIIGYERTHAGLINFIRHLLPIQYSMLVAVTKTNNHNVIEKDIVISSE